MDEQAVIMGVASEVRKRLAAESSGHDWWHTHRVWKMAVRLARGTAANTLVLQLTALLHDIADWKFHDGDEAVGPRIARSVLAKYALPGEITGAVCAVIPEISFKGAGVAGEPSTLEAQIVQDADRLDAIGAIGIARAFAYGGHAGQQLYDPDRPPVMHTSKEAYIAARSPTINHFYEKLLLLEDRFNTAQARQIAQQRREFMENYLRQFFDEWNEANCSDVSQRDSCPE
jgi:uncharacterized protein